MMKKKTSKPRKVNPALQLAGEARPPHLAAGVQEPHQARPSVQELGQRPSVQEVPPDKSRLPGSKNFPPEPTAKEPSLAATRWSLLVCDDLEEPPPNIF